MDRVDIELAREHGQPNFRHNAQISPEGSDPSPGPRHPLCAPLGMRSLDNEGRLPSSCESEKAKNGFNSDPVTTLFSHYSNLSSAQRWSLCSAVVLFFCISSLVSWFVFEEHVTSYLCLVFCVSFGAVAFAFWLLAWILAADCGTQKMKTVAEAIKQGSEGFFVVQYGAIFRLSLVASILLFFLYFFRDTVETTGLPSWKMALMTSMCFLSGAACSALSGYSGMWVSVRANVRVASAARRCYNESLQLCFRGGAFSSILNVAMALIGISFLLLFTRILLPATPLSQIPLLLVGYGFGASMVAMFAQLGGGIYTKAADIGADLVGKVEAGIPEDDPRNPAVIADLVGDNVGDCAGQCADLFESMAAEILSAMILGGSLAQEAQFEASGLVIFPLAVHCLDLVVSSLGIMLVRTKPGAPDADSAAGKSEDPLIVMIRAYSIVCLTATLLFGIICRIFLWVEHAPTAWWKFYICGILGMACSFAMLLTTQWYTDYKYRNVKKIAEASVGGPATNIIAGMAVGLESTALPVLYISIVVVGSFHLGQSTGILPAGRMIPGLYGTAVATMGMLSTAVFVLSMSSFGPIADNAGGIVEMAQESERVRVVTDRLDAVGNVTKANTKGFSVGSASLACFLLFSAFEDEVAVYSGRPFEGVDLSVPEVFVSGLLGSMLVFLFTAWALEAVGKTAQKVVDEVRRQIQTNPRILVFEELPDYQTCVEIVSRAALKEMMKPGLLAVCFPVIVGYIFRVIGNYSGNRGLGAQATASFLMFSTSTGILMALFLNNAGGAWDNAKKYVETGAFGGKNSEPHKAAVVGDTVGDPCKDTAGPSVHVLIKLIATITLVLTPVFVSKEAF
eukprot:GHVP01022958.1.p1 GENE.GHVP01022958.1~~GHVP01022958.1.p1  ORF type:complete len:850 (+),score=148.74 GHVP01022958.1:1495-4044(+)